MHNALRQPQIELPRVDFTRAGGLCAFRAIQQEHQVEIRAVAQLPAAQLAVTDHRKTFVPVAGQMCRFAVTSDHLPPRLLHHSADHRFCQPGKVITHLHHRQHAGDIFRRDPQQLCLFKLAQCLKLLLLIVFRNPHQILTQFITVRIQRQRLIE